VKRFALTLLLAGALVPALAQADRAPTKREKAAIARAADVPKRCLRVRVSTVNRRWASAYRRNAREGCERWQADGVAVFKRRKTGGWKFVVAGSSFECPVPRVPPAVVKDLDIPCF
jgi:hypothetical protein